MSSVSPPALVETPPTPPSPVSQRRYDLDWIRVGAFFLLILYHVGMFYVPWGWHVKSSHEVAALEPVMMLTNPWRLTLLFLVSGCATRFIADGFAAKGAEAGRLAGSRTLRLLPPLLFGMFVIVPPQSYYEVWEALRDLGVADPAGSPWLADFWVKYATASGGWCDAEGCLTTPTWNHLWFVAYLFVYSLVLALLLWPAGRAIRAAVKPLEFLLRGWWLILIPAVWFIAIRLTLAPMFEMTHALTDDWYNHALSFSAFLFGFVIARSESLKEQFARMWPTALIIALSCWVTWAIYAWMYREAPADEGLRAGMRVIYGLDQWAWIVAVMGFGAAHLNRGGPVLRYLTIGVFPFYIIHQTVIVVAGHHLAKLRWPFAAESLTLIAITFAACFVTYEIARRLGWLGLVLGVKPRGRAAAVIEAPR